MKNLLEIGLSFFIVLYTLVFFVSMYGKAIREDGDRGECRQFCSPREGLVTYSSSPRSGVCHCVDPHGSVWILP